MNLIVLEPLMSQRRRYSQPFRRLLVHESLNQVDGRVAGLSQNEGFDVDWLGDDQVFELFFAAFLILEG